jgi:hypothetical protein
MMVEPGKEIIESLQELRVWLDGFMTERASGDECIEMGPEGNKYEEWPFDIDRSNYDALATTIEFLKERRSDK